MMTSKEIAEMIQRAKEAEALFDDLRDDERPVYSTLQKVGSALDELIQFAERPVYEPVKPEDVKNGWYWSVDPAGKKTVDRIVWKYIVGGAQDVHVNDLAEAGFTFYRIPELPDDLEVSE